MKKKYKCPEFFDETPCVRTYFENVMTRRTGFPLGPVMLHENNKEPQFTYEIYIDMLKELLGKLTK
jgi:hypothetical protein